MNHTWKSNFTISLLIFIFSLCTVSAKYVTPPLSQSHKTKGSGIYQSFDPNHINALVWNIYKGGKRGWGRDFKMLADKYNLILTQEADSRASVQDILDELTDFRFDTAVSFGYAEVPNSFTGVMTGSNVKPSSFRFIRSKFTELFIKTHKVVSFTTYPLAGRDDELLAVNIHGMNMAGIWGIKEQLVSSMKLISNHDGPVIFGGDFNVRSDRRTIFMKKLFRVHNFKEVKFEDDRRRRSTITGKFLDYVFVRGLKVLSSDVLSHLKTSDHAAMAVELALE